MTSIGLNTGLKALLGARFALDTIGHNIANANTEGYSRQHVDLRPSTALQVQGLLIGNGVQADHVQRSVDDLLGRRIYSQRGISGGLVVQGDGLSELESLLNEPGEDGFGALLNDVFSSFSQLANNPADTVLRADVAQRANSLAARLNTISGALRQVTTDTGGQLAAEVDQVNSLASEIADLNIAIGSLEAGGEPANDLRDHRSVLLGQLAELVDVRVLDGDNGTVRVLVEGNTLVSSARAHALVAGTDDDGGVVVHGESDTTPVELEGGRLGGLLRLARERAPEYLERLDRLASSLVREINRVHATGIPTSGPMQSLTGANILVDGDLDGGVEDELLSSSGLPFEIQSGSLFVNLTDRASGLIEKHRIDISSTHTTVGDLLAALNEIPQLSADIDAQSRLRIGAANGYGFDFSPRMENMPDPEGAFGGGRASAGAPVGEPYALADGDTLDFTVNSGGTPATFRVVLDSSDFQEISSATAEELAAAINADPDAQANGFVATTVDGRVYFQTLATGSSAQFTIDGGTAAGALGVLGAVGVPVEGSDNEVNVRISGSFTGTSNQSFVFRPNMDGVIGTTPGLAIDVFDERGSLVSSIPVGDTYVPGAEVELVEGLTARFDLGELSATHGDAFEMTALQDSDTSGVLVAFGVNALLGGSASDDIHVRADLLKDPGRIATSSDGASGNSDLLLRLTGVENAAVDDLSGMTLSSYYGDIVSDVGFELGTAQSARESNDALIDSLEQRQASISGVNVDEELIDLVAFEQAFAAAAQYIQAVNQLGDEVLNLI